MSHVDFSQMHFEMELQQDLPREIDELMRMDVLGNFKLGKRIFDQIIDDLSEEGGSVPWPVVAEYLRFLYDQGNPTTVDSAVDTCLAIHKVASSEETDSQREQREQQVKLLQVLQAVTRTNRLGATEANVESVQRRVKAVLGKPNFVLSGMESLSEDEVGIRDPVSR